MLPAALLLLAQSAPAAAVHNIIPDGDDPVARAVETPRKRCLRGAGEGDIVVCGESQVSFRIPKADARFERGHAGTHFKAAGADGSVTVNQRTVGGVSAPALMVNFTWHF